MDTDNKTEFKIYGLKCVQDGKILDFYAKEKDAFSAAEKYTLKGKPMYLVVPLLCKEIPPRPNCANWITYASREEWQKYKELKAEMRAGKLIPPEDFALVKKLNQVKNWSRVRMRRRLSDTDSVGFKPTGNHFNV